MLTDDEIFELVTHARGVWRKASSEQFDELTVTLAEFGWLDVSVVRQAMSQAARLSDFLDLPSLVERMRTLAGAAVSADAHQRRRAALELDRQKWAARQAEVREYQARRRADLEWAAGLDEGELSRMCGEVLAANETMRPLLAGKDPRTHPLWIALLAKVTGGRDTGPVEAAAGRTVSSHRLSMDPVSALPSAPRTDAAVRFLKDGRDSVGSRSAHGGRRDIETTGRQDLEAIQRAPVKPSTSENSL
jgi:hypothetical protein